MIIDRETGKMVVSIMNICEIVPAFGNYECVHCSLNNGMTLALGQEQIKEHLENHHELCTSKENK